MGAVTARYGEHRNDITSSTHTEDIDAQTDDPRSTDGGGILPRRQFNRRSSDAGNADAGNADSHQVLV
jgi:hypothetical protein